ncbi:LysM peptidoglycan-binding domain-containing protein [Enterococcus sp. HY326]|uniref:aggregation-promoting factor n=1 Tax=Enterococcus sp. HY326 TaxID=2971265 RepID=UPI00223F4099|nr:LysM peptidoglycan-binding domain-containing protein [Enterococcus sp. HY326]
MKSIKTLLLGTAAIAGIGFFAGATNASAAEAYTVQSGDTLSHISSEFFGSDDYVNAIAEASGLTDANLIIVGQELSIPTEEEIANGTYTVAETTTSTATETTTDTTTTDTSSTSTYTSSVSGSEAEAKEWIAQKESGGSYTATNGQYIGRYQLTSSYLNGDYSAANQEAVADAYVASRYGSWTAAQAFWLANGWY